MTRLHGTLHGHTFIIAYSGGETFSKEDLKTVYPSMKKFTFVVDGYEEEGPVTVYAINSHAARTLIRKILVSGTKFHLFEHSVKKVGKVFHAKKGYSGRAGKRRSYSSRIGMLRFPNVKMPRIGI